jgi:hypothetical protein
MILRNKPSIKRDFQLVIFVTMCDALVPWRPSSVPTRLISAEELLPEIEYVCSGEEGSELIIFAYSKTLKERIDSWCQWFAETHPTESSAIRLAELDY